MTSESRSTTDTSRRAIFGRILSWQKARKIHPYYEVVIVSKARLIPTKRYSKNQIQRLLDQTSPHDRVALALAVHGGLSPEELVDLTPQCFDLDNAFIFVPAIQARHPRYIRIAPLVRDFIAPFLRHGKGAGSGLCQSDGTPLSRPSLETSLDRALQQAGLEICTLDDLRWSGAAWLLEAGMQYAAVAARFGVTRYTLYRRFPNSAIVKASQQLPLEEALAAIAVY